MKQLFFDTIRIVARDEVGTSRAPAELKVFRNIEELASFRAIIVHEMGADGGYYPVVKFEVVAAPHPTD